MGTSYILQVILQISLEEITASKRNVIYQKNVAIPLDSKNN